MFNGSNNYFDNLSKIENVGIFHLKGIFNSSEYLEVTKLLKQLNFSPLYDNENIARYEKSLSNNDLIIVIKKIKLILFQTMKKMNFKQNLGFEFYAFKYNKGQSIPPHKDMNRHKIIVIAYFGKYSGGEYVYIEPTKRKEIKINLSNGDVLVSINETPCGKVLNPIHWVNQITSGTRFCVVGSLVDNKNSKYCF